MQVEATYEIISTFMVIHSGYLVNAIYSNLSISEGNQVRGPIWYYSRGLPELRWLFKINAVDYHTHQ